MGQRVDFHAILETILESDNVYFQPPPNISINYPCIVYKLDDIKTEYADNNPYKLLKRYTVTLIDRNPDSEFVLKLAELTTAIYDRFYTANNLNHYVFRIYF